MIISRTPHGAGVVIAKFAGAFIGEGNHFRIIGLHGIAVSVIGCRHIAPLGPDFLQLRRIANFAHHGFKRGARRCLAVEFNLAGLVSGAHARVDFGKFRQQRPDGPAPAS